MIKIAPVDYQTYGFEYGNSARTNAHKYAQAMNNLHTNAMGGGRRRKQYRKLYGGEQGQVVVPQWHLPGPSVSPVDSNALAIIGNTGHMQALSDSMNDCFATNTCGQGGGTRKTKRSNKRSNKHSNKRSNTKRSKTKRSKTKRSNTKRSKTKRSNTKRSNTKRSNTKRSNTKRSKTKRSKTKRSKTKRSNTKRSNTKRSNK